MFFLLVSSFLVAAGCSNGNYHEKTTEKHVCQFVGEIVYTAEYVFVSLWSQIVLKEVPYEKVIEKQVPYTVDKIVHKEVPVYVDKIVERVR